MKKILLLLSFFYLIVSASSVFAYELSDKDWDLVDRRVEMYEQQIEQKGESYRSKILRSLDGRIRIFSRRNNTERIVAINQWVRDMLAEWASNGTAQNASIQSDTQWPMVVYNTTTNNVVYNNQTQNNTSITQNNTWVKTNTPIKYSYEVTKVNAKIVNTITTGLKVGDTDVSLGEFQLEIQNNNRGLEVQGIVNWWGCSDRVKNLSIYEKTTGKKVSWSIIKDWWSCYIKMNDTISVYTTHRTYQIRGDIVLPGQLRILIGQIIMQELVTGYRPNMQNFPWSDEIILTDTIVPSPVIINPQPSVPVSSHPVVLVNQSNTSSSVDWKMKDISLLKYQIVNNSSSDLPLTGETYNILYSGSYDVLQKTIIDFYVDGNLVDSIASFGARYDRYGIDGKHARVSFNFGKSFWVKKNTAILIELKARDLSYFEKDNTIQVSRDSLSTDIVWGTIIVTTPTIPATKLVIAAAGISDAGAGKVKFKIANDGTDSIMVKDLYISSSAGTVTLYKGEITTESERISAHGASVTSGSAIAVDQQATKLEIAAGQTVTILADLDGIVTGDSNTINVTLNDIAYFEKIQGTYSTTAITSIKSYNGTGLPASTSFSHGAGAY